MFKRLFEYPGRGLGIWNWGVLAIASVLPCGALVAQTDTFWDVAGPGNWNTAGNWTGSFVPNNGNGGTNWNVFINNGNTVDLNTTATINQLNLDVGNALNILNFQTLNISNTGQPGAGVLNNDGTVNINGTGSSTFLNFFGTTAINGNGTINLGGGANTHISGSGTLTHGAGHTIQGSGNLGNNGLSIINQGTVQAGSGDVMTIDPSNAGSGVPSFVNNGLVRAFSGGQITLTGNGAGEFGGSGIYRAENGSQINLTTSAIVRNTIFDTSGSGQINIVASNAATWEDISNLGNSFIRNFAALDVLGSLNNQGTITVAGTGSATQLRINNSVNLSGGGNIVLDHANASISGLGAGLLTNFDNTISGTGNVGNNSTRIVNQGLIRAGTGETLVIDPANAGTNNFGLDNQGTVRATSGGVITLTGSAGGEFHGSGVYEALAGSSINLTAGAIARNTNFNTVGDGQINIMASQTIDWDSVSNQGNTVLQNFSWLQLHNSLDNQGTVTVTSTGSSTQLRAIGNVNLTGGGNIVLSHSSASIAGGGLLHNADNTISGIGNIGLNAISVDNLGVIQAGTGHNLVIDPANGGAGVATFNNIGAGIVRAANGGVVTLTGNGGGEFAGTGTFEALNGSNLIFDTSAIVQNVSSNTLNSGTWRVISGGSATNVRIQNNATDLINTIGANAAVELSGANSNFTVRAANVAIDTTLNNVAGSLILRDGRTMNLGGGLTNSGDILLDGSMTSLTVNGDYTQSGGSLMLLDGAMALLTGTNNTLTAGMIGGNGTIVGDLLNVSGNVSPGASPGELSITGDYEQGALATFTVEIGGLVQGGSYDHLLVGGDAILDGTLAVSLFGAFTPNALDTFTILSANSLVGTFANAMTQITVLGGGTFDVSYTSNSVVLSNFNAIPEPGTGGLIILAMCGAALYRRRR
ncbi:MAG: PEP-CTERM sorting domain-containing protein [Pirellulaceae bacterium]|nr:PEP-CTERM sorting domain-containing protein [Pirellulaceae bacterium]